MALLIAGCGSATPPGSGGASAPQVATYPTDARVRGCQERIEGPRLAVRPALDTRIGAVTFPNLPAAYDAAVGTLLRTGKAVPMKLFAVVDAGTAPTLAVPKAEQDWLQLRFGSFNRGEEAVTLSACSTESSRAQQRTECGWTPFNACTRGVTQFSGGFFVDFKRAPDNGSCATLEVWPTKNGPPIVEPLFRKAGC